MDPVTPFRSPHELPLHGVRVLDFAHLMQGPWAAEMLADLGADVIKVEHVVGGERGRQSGAVTVGGHSAMFLAMNRNKRSLALDLKADAGRAIALDLVREADVLIQNFRPGAMDRLGLGWEQVRELNPRLVYCSASGYGPHAPGLPGQDLLAQARSGAMWLTGADGSPPSPSGPFIADIHAASMLALGAVAALHGRSTTGRGQLVEVDLVGAMLHQMTQEIVAHRHVDVPPGRPPVPANPFMEGPYGVYRTADGWLAISICPVAELAGALGAEGLAERYPDKDAAYRRREELSAEVSELLRPHPTASLLARLQERGVWCSPVNDLDTMADDPAVGWPARHVVADHPHAGPITQVLHPLALDGGRLPVRSTAPLHGEHSREVLGDLGLSADAIEDLVAAGVVVATEGVRR